MIYHNYIFLTIRSEYFDVSENKQKKYRKEFLSQLESNKSIVIGTYATVGLKKNSQILLWLQGDSLETIQQFANTLLHTQLGRFLKISYTLFGMARPTQYSDKSTIHLHTLPKGKKYLIIYPFTKTKEWYMLEFEKRRKLMGGHVAIGKKYPQIEQVLLYSYGVDDNEFIVSYETDDLLLFQSLVMELRTDPVRAYTQSDTPIFTCLSKTPKEVLEFL